MHILHSRKDGGRTMDNLSADMIQCRKDGFGCRYGAWKALQPKIRFKREQTKELDDGRRVCENCGVVFFHYKSGVRKYCSSSCAHAFYYENNKERLKEAYQRRKAEREAKCNVQNAETV